MKNKLVKALALNNHVRIYCLNSTELVQQARLTHNLFPTSLAALGRVMSVSAIMAMMQKNEKDRIITQINGGGAIGTIMVEAKSNGDIRGFVGDNEIYLKYNDSNKLAVGLAVGTNGYLKITKDFNLKDQFSGQVALQTGEIGDDFAYYFSVSEQTPSIVSCGVLVDTDYSCKTAGALLIQLMPDAIEEDIVKVEELLKTLKPISELLSINSNPKDIVKTLFDDVQLLEEVEVRWQCNCERERFKAGLMTLKIDDLEEMIKEDHQAEVKCEYCNSTYIFDEIELNEIVEMKKTCGK